MSQLRRQRERIIGEPLTPREQKVYLFIVAHVCIYGRPPTVRRICSEFGWKSTNSATEVIEFLVQKGRLETMPTRKSVALIVLGVHGWQPIWAHGFPRKGDLKPDLESMLSFSAAPMMNKGNE